MEGIKNGNKPKEIRYDLLGAKVVENLQKRHFDAYYCQTKEDALKKAIELIPEDDVVSWGGSVSIDEIGLLNYVKENLEDSNILPKEILKLKRYDYAYKIGFDKNKEIALVFIKENENSLSLAEQNFLSELFIKSANLINKLRIEYLYREVK